MTLWSMTRMAKPYLTASREQAVCTYDESADNNLPAQKAREVDALVTAAGATLKYWPPYSHDLHPIELGWGLFKKRLRTVALRIGPAWRCTAQRARAEIRPRHCQTWFAHAGHRSQLKRSMGQERLTDGLRDAHGRGQGPRLDLFFTIAQAFPPRDTKQRQGATASGSTLSMRQWETARAS